MRLLVSCIPYDGGKSGISTYVREVVRALAEQGHVLTLLCEPEAQLSTFNSIFAPRWTRRAALSMLWHLFVLPFWLRRHRRDFDGFVICSANRRVCAWYPIETTATVHDLANFHVPGKYSRLRMFYLAHVLPFFAKRAQHLVAVSEATRTDMVKYWHCREEDVTVLYNGLSKEERLKVERLKVEREKCGGESSGGQLSTFNFQLSTILYISRIEHPGKNHVRLIEAYGKLPREVAEAHPLVIAGADWKDAEVVHEAAKKSPHADLIRFTGFFVDAADMPRLWGEAGFYVFPSLFEGFGLSLIEAMARGIPCACSNNGSLGEIAGDVAVTFDPYDVDSIAGALRNLMGEPQEAREARVARGYEWIKRFSWEDHARGIAGLLGRAGEPDGASVFGVRIDCDTNEQAARALREGGGRAFAFVNAHCLNVAFDDREYREILARVFCKVWPDGVGVRMAGRRLGFNVPENVNGTDLIPMVAAAGGLSFWFLGGRPGVAEEALRRCSERFPASRFLGATDGYRTNWSEVLPEIDAARPDVLLVAMGVPLQEKWIAAHRDALPHVGSIVAVGGLLDFMSGRIPRAPRIIRRCSLEWAWRLAMEPRRMFRRYVIGNFVFLHRVAAEARRRCRP